MRGTPKRRTKRRTQREEISTALLLPGVHPWLKQYLTDENLITFPREERWKEFPLWERLPAPTTNVSRIVHAHLAMDRPESRAKLREAPPPTDAHPGTQPASQPVQHSPVRRSAVRAIATPQSKPPMQSLAMSPSLPPAARTTLLRMKPLAPTQSPTHTSRAIHAPEAAPARAPVPTARASHAIASRRSSAPTPFTIPLDSTSPPPAPTHLLRLHRPLPQPTRTAPNLVAALQERVAASLPVLQRPFPFSHSKRRDPERRTSGAIQPAPTVTIPEPYDELLLVSITAGPAVVLWESILWPIWRVFRLPLPSALAASCVSAIRNARLALRPIPALTPGGIRMRNAFGTRTLQLVPIGHLATVAALLTIAVLPVKLLGLTAEGIPTIRGRVLGATASIVDDLRSGGLALTHVSFTEAVASFDRVRAGLESIPANTLSVPPALVTLASHLPGLDDSLGRAERARQAGITLARASSAATRGLALLASTELTDAHALQLLDAASASFTTARTLAQNARPYVRTAAPGFIGTLAQAENALERAESLLPILRALAGIDRPQRALLLFQNPAELRPTGGFMGSLALLDVDAGSVTALSLPEGGTYDVSGLTRIRVLPPDPLRLIAPTWQLHDANWFPDFPTSAQKIRWFYEKSGGPSVDAVIAVNAPLLEDLLALTGPITVGGQTFTATDILASLTNIVESAGARESGTPKAIIAELAPELLQRLLAATTDGDAHQRVALLDLLLRALDERDVLLAFTDDAIQRHAARAGWSGAIRPAPHDALMVVHANIGGGKTDARMRDHISHVATIRDDGSVVDTVTITRTHEGAPTAAELGSPFEHLASMHYVGYLRVYVPRGSKLLEATGFEPPLARTFEAAPADAIPDRDLLATELHAREHPDTGVRTAEEFGRTVFGGWVQVPAGTARTIQLSFELPWRYAQTERMGLFGTEHAAPPQPYSLLIQKQPGTRTTVQHVLHMGTSWQTPWHAPNLTARGEHAWGIETVLTNDLYTGAMIAPR